jgi:glutamyl-Q tRNA(Asp) synthetase
MATATTATADVSCAPGSGYTGRFAPSPTGPLHLGSLTTALASCLEARVRGGRWLLRIEDLDTPRTVPGAADTLLRTLEALGFTWEGDVVWQSRRSAAFHAALEQLQRQDLAYPCSCSRRQLQEQEVGDGGYPGTCRRGTTSAPPWSIRFRMPDDAVICIDDGLAGRVCSSLARLGDPVIRRRDGLFAYQLAVVVDDAAAGVTDVVRGADLLGSCAWQRCLQRALGVGEPRYVHVPVVVATDGSKLSKSANAVPLDVGRAARWLCLGLELLCQHPPTTLSRANVAEVWQWALESWDLQALRGLTGIRNAGILPTPVVAD